MNIFGGDNLATWWILLGLGPWRMVKFVVKIRWIFLKRKIKTIKSNKQLPILHRKFRRIPKLHTYSETSPAKLRQRKTANEISPLICI